MKECGTQHMAGQEKKEKENSAQHGNAEPQRQAQYDRQQG